MRGMFYYSFIPSFPCMNYTDIQSVLANKAEDLLGHECTTISRDRLHIPSGSHLDDVFGISDRSDDVIENLRAMYNH